MNVPDAFKDQLGAGASDVNGHSKWGRATRPPVAESL